MARMCAASLIVKKIRRLYFIVPQSNLIRNHTKPYILRLITLLHHDNQNDKIRRIHTHPIKNNQQNGQKQKFRSSPLKSSNSYWLFAKNLYNYIVIIFLCESGGTGRRARLRGVWSNSYGFKSRLSHQGRELSIIDSSLFIEIFESYNYTQWKISDKKISVIYSHENIGIFTTP